MFPDKKPYRYGDEIDQDKRIDGNELVRGVLTGENNESIEKCSDYARETRKSPGGQGAVAPMDRLYFQRDLTVGTTTAGGHTVATELVSFIDALRNKILCAQAGATVLRDLVGDVAIPKLSAGGTAHWVAESGAPTEGDQTFAQITMSPKTVAAYTDVSRKLLIQSQLDIQGLVLNDLATDLAIEIDRVCLHGSGTDNQPLGIIGTSGIGSVVGGTNGLAPAWSHIVELETDVAVGNGDVSSMGYMINSKTKGKLSQTFANPTYGETPLFTRGKDGNGEVNGYPCLVTNQVASNLTKGSSSGVCSAIFFGSWSQLVISMWGSLELIVDPYTHSTTGGRRLSAFADVDVCLRHPEAFSCMLDCLTT